MSSPSSSAGRFARWELAVIGIWFVVFAGLAELFPRSGDDWGWGSLTGTQRLHNLFRGLNGRYAGDLLVMGLVRSGPAAALVVAAIVCVSLVLVLDLADARTPIGYAMAGLLFLVMPLGTWRQGVVWLSGFANYAAATLVLLSFLVLVRADRAGRLRTTVPRIVLTAVAGFVGQLFMEYVSACILLLGIGFVVICRRANRRWPRYVLTWTIAALGGTVLMFTNSAYRTATTGDGPYQKVQSLAGKDAFQNLVTKLFDTICGSAVVSNLVLNCAIGVCVITLAIMRRRDHPRAALSVMVLTVAFLALSINLWLGERHSSISEGARQLAGLAALLLLVLLLVTAARLIEAPRRRATMRISCVALVLMLGPLLFVNPIGPRCFYPSYVVLLIVATTVAAEVREKAPAVDRNWLRVPMQLATVGVLIWLFVVYASLHSAVDRRLAEIRQAERTNATTVMITPLPHSYYVHDGDPWWSTLVDEFDSYYHVSDDLVVKLKPNPWARVPGRPDRPLP